ncbi:MAG TPA: beta-propeller domain-containing protein [Polyangiales bacterium]
MPALQRLLISCLLACATAVGGCGQNQSAAGGTTSKADGGTKPGGALPDGGTSSGTKPGVTPDKGATEFVSADQSTGNNNARAPGAFAGAAAKDSAAEPPAGGTGTGATDPRSVERGDIFRVLGDHRILSLNSYRGVQVIDITDVSAPRVEGRLAITGTPVEMYVVGNRAFVLLNSWQGYYGTRGDVRVQSVQGGLLLSVDISDRKNPKLLDQFHVAGDISTSRLTQNQSGTQAALYVAAQVYDTTTSSTGAGVSTSSASTPHNVLQSFDVSTGKLVSKSMLDLGGYVQDVQATTDVVMVASTDYTQSQQTSTVSLVDISRPDGSMVKGDVISVSGLVQNKFNMDIYNGVLRVVSAGSWNGSSTNHLETFDVHNLASATSLAHCTFGAGQSLQATLFVKNAGFFVSYLRTDPLHTFSIDDQGKCQEHAEFVVTGWNDFFRSVGGDTRLVGIGHNDATTMTNKLSVSLYDITSLANPNPLLARADIDLAWAYSEGSWDDRAFTVLEGVASATASDGTAETGLVLLPFQGWDSKTQQSLAEVQIFTFSDHTLTRRGLMDHGSPVRRSFPTATGTTANLSEDQLSLFDTRNTDAPKELGRVDVAPNYTRVLFYGNYVARLKDRSYYWGYSSSQSVLPPKTEVQILARSADLDGADPIATIQLPASAQVTQVGSLLVSVDMVYDSTLSAAAVTAAGGEPTSIYHCTVEVYDLSQPTTPRKRGTLKTDALQPNDSYGYGYWYGGYPAYGGFVGGGAKRSPGIAIDCLGCGGGGYYYGGYYGSYPALPVVGQAIVFAHTRSQQKSLGMVHSCYSYPNNAPCGTDKAGNTTCPATTYQGQISCLTPQGAKEYCTGEYVVCDDQGTCKPGAAALGTMTNCSDYENIRYWSSFSFDFLDVSKPDAPKLAPRVDMPTDQEGTSVYTDDSGVYFNYQKPIAPNNDPHPAVKHYFSLIDLSDPAHPAAQPGVNIPGDVIASDTGVVYTRDVVWDAQQTETLVARLKLSGGLAHLQATRLLQDRIVSAVQLDGAGHVLVSHDPAWSYYWYGASTGGTDTRTHRLSILNTGDLSVAGETDVDQWATFVTAKAGEAVYSVSGGILLVNVKDPTKPFAQAYFPTMGWSSDMVLDQGEIVLAAGPYGVYRFDASTYNLLMK